MKRDIILCGVGGQGILTIAAVIGRAAMDAGLHIKQAEVHGMSQRGGDVQSHLRISSDVIHSDLIPRGGADAILALEPLEALRYLPYLSQDGWIVSCSSTFENIPNYPAGVPEGLAGMENVMMVRSDGSSRGANITLLGAASAILGIEEDALLRALEATFAAKGENVVAANLAAFGAGRSEIKERYGK